ncbi:multiprotein bridging factor aMBF1 [Halanaeroarchaeum sulfurireducens]|uniref:XRE family transcriptional regulator n=1 Tax=Halanaeroarchaeum sulfurireducens TaxID=1604004 RepID=A0A0F7PCY2_9EURY|nr:multiprotein bridging factor aMBF1 [Halanaeroarchaeum sulfurireducens]AKH98030.1 XRE family transcriptional regulator [Halanaeroarchaeum sulfurireducens]ALG82424.1 XRE family transcriptional regulator [Halanaeroarchaeum sulfurireducens]
MVQCEMCGAETASPNTVKIEGAELQVCDSCAEFGTEVKTESSGSTSTKYSTSSSSGGSSSSTSSQSGGSSDTRRRDMFDEMDEVVADYDQRIRKARESAELTQEELAKQVSEKASLVRKLEQGDMLPSDDVQRKLESFLDISLTESAEGDDEEWESGGDGQGLTLGDMVKRKD